MKTSFLSLFLAYLVFFTCDAQTQKGSKMIGGNGAASFGKVTSIGLHPSFGYFLMDDLAVGSGVLLSYSRFKEVGYRTMGGGVEPYVRYYLGKQAPTRFFAQANGAFSYLQAKNTGDSHYGSGYTGNSFGGSVGIVRFITEQVGLEAQFHYNNYQNVQTDGFRTTHDSRQDNYGLRFGIQVHLPSSRTK
jgi:hypothetical protein